MWPPLRACRRHQLHGCAVHHRHHRVRSRLGGGDDFHRHLGGIGTLEGPIVGTAIYYGIRELLTNVFALSGSWYLVTLGAVAVAAMPAAPRGIWPFIRERFGIEWLSISRKLADAAAPANSAAVTPEVATTAKRI